MCYIFNTDSSIQINHTVYLKIPWHKIPLCLCYSLSSPFCHVYCTRVYSCEHTSNVISVCLMSGLFTLKIVNKITPKRRKKSPIAHQNFQWCIFTPIQVYAWHHCLCATSQIKPSIMPGLTVWKANMKVLNGKHLSFHQV